jgi:hypothetical protein
MVGDSSRGSSAFGGRADILMAMKFADAKKRTTRRLLEAVGRYDGIPLTVMLDIRDGRYTAIGEGRDAVVRGVAMRIQELLERADGVVLGKELQKDLGPEVAASTCKRALKLLVTEGVAQRIEKQGTNKRSHGFRLQR